MLINSIPGFPIVWNKIVDLVIRFLASDALHLDVHSTRLLF